MDKAVYNHMLSAAPSVCCQKQSWHLALDFYPLWVSQQLKCCLRNKHKNCKLCFKLLPFNLTWIMHLELQKRFPIRQLAKSTLQILSKVASALWWHLHCFAFGFLFCLCTIVLNFLYSLSEIHFQITLYSSSPTIIRIVYHNKPKARLVWCSISSDDQYQTPVAARQKVDNRQ